MKYLKTYNESIFDIFKSKRNIKNICEKYGIKNYTINRDGSIDVDGGVDLRNMQLTKLPLKFNIVTGYFDCQMNKLTSLEGCPKEVGDAFCCHYNELTSLKGCPEIINIGLECGNNFLKNLENSPKIINGYFICNNNKLTSLKGATKSIKSGFLCYNNQLTSLEGCPETNYIDCRDNNIITLEYLPHLVKFECYFNPIYEIWKLFDDCEKIEFFNYCDPIREPNIIILDRLNEFLTQIGKKPVTEVKGYKCI